MQDGLFENMRMMEMLMEITFIRNGATARSLEGKFIGRTDEPLCEEGALYLYERVKAHCYPEVSRVYTSGYRRCRETASIIYPRLPALLESMMNTFDFGAFEGRSYNDLKHVTAFQDWAVQEEVRAFPGGEPPQQSMAVNMKEFVEIIDDLQHSMVDKAAIITHKSVILAVLNRYMLMGRRYTGEDIAYGGGVTVIFDTSNMTLTIKKKNMNVISTT
jgi:alpha-ribazole phosphatase